MISFSKNFVFSNSCGGLWLRCAVDLFTKGINILFLCYLIRLPSKTTSSRWEVDKEAVGLLGVQQFLICVTRSSVIFVNFVFKHIHSVNVNTICR